MRKFLFKFLLFSLPFVIYAAYLTYEVLILPLNFYTFRGWEALSVTYPNDVLVGPFYPNMYLKIDEEGDQAHVDPFKEIKKVEWFTDKYGFRKKNSEKKKHEIVIIGDSYGAGATLTQEDMLSEQLEKRLGVSVYPYAPRNINQFIQDKRFAENPPDIVIFEVAEKLSLHVTHPNFDLKPKENLFEKLKTKKFISEIFISLDRIKKRQLFNYLYARIQNISVEIVVKALGPVSSPEVEESVQLSEPNQGAAPVNLDFPGLNVGKDGKMVFSPQSEEYFVDYSDRDIREDGYVKLKKYQEVLSQRGTKFIFLPIPNKENIYWQNVKGGRKTDFLKKLIRTSKDEGIVTIDTQALYQDAKNEYPEKLLYWPDDSHWTPYGVALIAEEITNTIKAMPF